MDLLLKRIFFSLSNFIVFIPFINYDNGLRCVMAPCGSISSGSILIYLFRGFPHVHQINYFFLFGGILITSLGSYFLIKKKN